MCFDCVTRTDPREHANLGGHSPVLLLSIPSTFLSGQLILGDPP